MVWIPDSSQCRLEVVVHIQAAQPRMMLQRLGEIIDMARSDCGQLLEFTRRPSTWAVHPNNHSFYVRIIAGFDELAAHDCAGYLLRPAVPHYLTYLIHLVRAAAVMPPQYRQWQRGWQE